MLFCVVGVILASVTVTGTKGGGSSNSQGSQGESGELGEDTVKFDTRKQSYWYWEQIHISWDHNKCSLNWPL